jgi:hypothetical protein
MFDPLIRDIFPVRAISLIENFESSFSIAAVLPGSPVTSNIIESSDKSTT